MSRRVRETTSQRASEEEVIVIDYKPEDVIGDYPNISTMVDKVILIEDVEWRDTERGRIYYVHTTNGTYYTWSRVLGRQLEEIKDMIEEHRAKGKKVRVRARILRRKNYLMLGEA